MLARVVSKWMLLGTLSPFLTIAPKRTRSAARPWWVGMTWLKPKIEPDGLFEMIEIARPGVGLVAGHACPAHWSSLMAEVPESVRRSIVTFSAGMPKTLKPDCLSSDSLSAAGDRAQRLDDLDAERLHRRLDVGHRILPNRSRLAGADVSQNVVSLRNWRNRASTRSRSSVRKRPMPKSSMANEAMTLP